MEASASSHVLFSPPISPLCLRWIWQLCQIKERGWELRSKSWRKLWSLWASPLLLSQVTLTSREKLFLKFSWETVGFTPPSMSDHCSCTEIYKSISESQVRPPSSDASPGSSQVKPISRQGGTILLPAPPAPGSSQDQTSGSSLGLQLSQGYTPMFGGSVSGETVDTDRSYFFKLKLVFTSFCPSSDPEVQAFYGGRMTDDRLLAVKNATSEAIDHLHKSLESCPNDETEAPDPRGIKVRLCFCLLFNTWHY